MLACPPQTRLNTSLRKAKGNVSQEMKDKLADFYEDADDFCHFMFDIMSDMEATEMSLLDGPEEPQKKQLRTVFEMKVTPGEWRQCGRGPSLHSPSAHCS